MSKNANYELIFLASLGVMVALLFRKKKIGLALAFGTAALALSNHTDSVHSKDDQNKSDLVSLLPALIPTSEIKKLDSNSVEKILELPPLGTTLH